MESNCGLHKKIKVLRSKYPFHNSLLQIRHSILVAHFSKATSSPFPLKDPKMKLQNNYLVRTSFDCHSKCLSKLMRIAAISCKKEKKEQTRRLFLYSCHVVVSCPSAQLLLHVTNVLLCSILRSITDVIKKFSWLVDTHFTPNFNYYNMCLAFYLPISKCKFSKTRKDRQLLSFFLRVSTVVL